jgi:hypothetical protein
MRKRKTFIYSLALTGSLFLALGEGNATKTRLLLEGLELCSGKFLGRSFTSTRPTYTFSRNFFSTTPSFLSEREEIMKNSMKKKLQVVGFGTKNYKFDPKTSMYYYEDAGTKELEAVATPVLKDFGSFVEFDAKKKPLNDK